MRPDEREDGADMADMMRRGEHIWLRQSATFAVDGQTRMVEIAIPLRPGASAEEVEALLRQADAGMERLGRHLDARVAAARGVPDGAPAVAAPPPAPPAPTRVEAPAPAAPLPPAPPGPTPSATPRPAPTPASGEEHRAAASEPATPVHARSGGAPVRETAPTPRAAPPPPPSQPARPVPAPPPAPSAAPLTLPQFLGEAQAEFGFTPRQVMEQLNVRSLSGVNYREALETLRRQSLREGAAAPAPPRIPAAAPPEPSPPPATPHYFEEELDEPEVIFGVHDMDGGALDGDPNPYAASDTGDDEEDDALLETLDLEEAEDAMPPPTPIRPSAARQRSPGRGAPAPATAPAPEAPAGGEHDTDGAEAVRLITQLRDVQAGGVPSSYQRTAYRNLVVGQLGDETAKAVVAALYRVSPERLGPEQLDALVSWGKRDGFADEVELVLAELRAERARAARQTSATSAAPAASTETAPRRAPRTEKKD